MTILYLYQVLQKVLALKKKPSGLKNESGQVGIVFNGQG